MVTPSLHTLIYRGTGSRHGTGLVEKSRDHVTDLVFTGLVQRTVRVQITGRHQRQQQQDRLDTHYYRNSSCTALPCTQTYRSFPVFLIVMSVSAQLRPIPTLPSEFQEWTQSLPPAPYTCPGNLYSRQCERQGGYSGFEFGTSVNHADGSGSYREVLGTAGSEWGGKTSVERLVEDVHEHIQTAGTGDRGE